MPRPRSRKRAPSLQDRDVIAQALQQYASNRDGAIAMLRPLAENGNLAAAALLAATYVQYGSWTEGVGYARQLAAAGIPGPLLNYVGNMMGDPTNRPEAVEFVRVLKDAGWSVDPMLYASQVAQAGDTETALALVELGMLPEPAGARQQWEELLEATQPAAESIKGSVASVEAEKDRAIRDMQEQESHVRDERIRIEEVVKEVADLASLGAAGHLAKEYAEQAKRTEDTAAKYRKWAIITGALAAVATAVIAFFAFTQADGVGGVLTKAALAIPFLAFAAYIAGLERLHRRQAWRWRHIELQIRTANPFLSPLPDDQRRLLIAALALRFFPGQLIGDEAREAGEYVDPVSALGELFKQLPGTPTTPAREQPSPPSTP